MRNRFLSFLLMLAAWAWTLCPSPAMAHACCDGFRQARQDIMPCCVMQPAGQLQAQNNSFGEPPPASIATSALPASGPHPLEQADYIRSMLDSTRLSDLQDRRYTLLCVLLN